MTHETPRRQSKTNRFKKGKKSTRTCYKVSASSGKVLFTEVLPALKCSRVSIKQEQRHPGDDPSAWHYITGDRVLPTATSDSDHPRFVVSEWFMTAQASLVVYGPSLPHAVAWVKIHNVSEQVRRKLCTLANGISYSTAHAASEHVFCSGIIQSWSTSIGANIAEIIIARQDFRLNRICGILWHIRPLPWIFLLQHCQGPSTDSGDTSQYIMASPTAKMAPCTKHSSNRGDQWQMLECESENYFDNDIRQPLIWLIPHKKVHLTPLLICSRNLHKARIFSNLWDLNLLLRQRRFVSRPCRGKSDVCSSAPRTFHFRWIKLSHNFGSVIQQMHEAAELQSAEEDTWHL